MKKRKWKLDNRILNEMKREYEGSAAARFDEAIRASKFHEAALELMQTHKFSPHLVIRYAVVAILSSRRGTARFRLRDATAVLREVADEIERDDRKR
jgi:hypothetical protein